MSNFFSEQKKLAKQNYELLLPNTPKGHISRRRVLQRQFLDSNSKIKQSLLKKEMKTLTHLLGLKGLYHPIFWKKMNFDIFIFTDTLIYTEYRYDIIFCKLIFFVLEFFILKYVVNL